VLLEIFTAVELRDALEQFGWRRIVAGGASHAAILSTVFARKSPAKSGQMCPPEGRWSKNCHWLVIARPESA
jgi:hypothetical protein